MNYFGWTNSPASQVGLRCTRTPGGSVTDRTYRLTTMLTEDGDIHAVGESDIRDPETRKTSRKAAQVTIPRAALRLPSEPLKVNQWNVNDKKPLAWDLNDVVEPYLCMLDKMVEGAVPVALIEPPALAAIAS